MQWYFMPLVAVNHVNINFILFLEKNVDYFLANSLVFLICLTEKTWLIVIRNDYSSLFFRKKERKES